MANIKISELTALTPPAAADELPVVDVSATSTKKTTVGEVVGIINGDVEVANDGTATISELPVSKLQDGAARQLLQTDAAGTGVGWTSNVDVPGTLDVTSTATFDSIAQHPLGTAGAPTITFTGDTNTGIYSPGADQVAISTNGTKRLSIDSTGFVELFDNDLYLTKTGLGNGQITFNGSTFSFISNSSTAPIVFGKTSQELMRLDSSGRLGLGTSSPGATLDVSGNDNLVRFGDGTNTFDVRFKGPNNWDVQLDTSADKFNIRRNSSSFVTVDGAGRLGIGTTSPSAILDVKVASDAKLLVQDGNTTGNVRFNAVNNAVSANVNLEISASNTQFFNGGSERLRITSAGLVGVGTTSPTDAQLYVNSSAIYGVRINHATLPLQSFLVNGTQAFSIGANSGGGGSFYYGTGNIEAARIDSSGRLLVGTSSARSNFFNSSISAISQVEEVGGGTACYSAITNVASATGPAFVFGKTRGGSVGSNTVVVADDGIGALSFQGSDGSEFVEAATIRAYVDGTPGTNDMPGRLVFSTTADGASSPTERMRIGASGNVGIGQSDQAGIRLAVTSTGTAYAGYFSYPGSTAQGVGFNSTGAGSSYAAYFFNNGSNVGSIYTTSSATSYNTSSDYRLKENVTPLTGAIDRVNDLQVHRFNFIADPDKTVDGFIAHEAQAVVPECVTGEKDAVDADGNPVYQGIDQSKLVPLLTAALQEALAEIESLKARVTALEP